MDWEDPDAENVSPEKMESRSDEFYAILMVEKTATTSEINNAYKKLSLQFHPDKHESTESKKSAEKLFNRIKRARDVLIDPHLRRIYDALGMDGLKEFEDSQLVRRDLRSAKEVIEEYERLKEFKKYNEELASYNPSAETSVTVDACSLFQSDYYNPEFLDYLTLTDQISDIEMSKMNLSQGISVPINDTDDLVVSAQMQSDFIKNHTNGHFTCQWHHRMVNDKSMSCSLTVGSQTEASLDGFWQIHSRCAVNGRLVCTIVQGAPIYNIQAGLAAQLSKRLKAELSGCVGTTRETVKYKMTYTGESFTASGYLQAGLSFYHLGHSVTRVGLSAVKSFSDHHLTVKGSTLLSLSGFRLSSGFQKNFPEKKSRIGSTLILDSIHGVTLNIRLSRGRQTLRLPLLFSTEIQTAATIYGLVLPSIAFLAVRGIFILPYFQKQREKYLAKRKEEEKEAMAQRRADALEEVSLMRVAVDQIIRTEDAKSGLVIVKALYGKLQVIQENADNTEDIVDVSVPLQNQVKDSSLKIPGQISKVNLPGFYDPCFGEDKKLYIRYKFRGQLHQVTVDDSDPICLPKQGHLISSPSATSIR